MICLALCAVNVSLFLSRFPQGKCRPRVGQMRGHPETWTSDTMKLVTRTQHFRGSHAGTVVERSSKAGLAEDAVRALGGMVDLLRGKGRSIRRFSTSWKLNSTRPTSAPTPRRSLWTPSRQSFRDKEITGEVEVFVKQQASRTAFRCQPRNQLPTVRADGRP